MGFAQVKIWSKATSLMRIVIFFHVKNAFDGSVHGMRGAVVESGDNEVSVKLDPAGPSPSVALQVQDSVGWRGTSLAMCHTVSFLRKWVAGDLGQREVAQMQEDRQGAVHCEK